MVRLLTIQNTVAIELLEIQFQLAIVQVITQKKITIEEGIPIILTIFMRNIQL